MCILICCFNTVTLASLYTALPDDGDHTKTLLYPKGDGGFGTQNVERVDREGSLECVGTHKN